MVQSSQFTVYGSQSKVRCPMADVAKSEEGVPSEAGNIWFASAGVPPPTWQQALQAPRSAPMMVTNSGRARRVGLPRRKNSMSRCGESPYFHVEHIMGHQDGHPHLRSALRKLSEPQTRFRRVQAQLPSPSPRDSIPPRNFILFFGSTCRPRPTSPEVRSPSDRSGSLREAWSEGPKVLHSSGTGERGGDRTRGPRKLWRCRGRSLRASGSRFTDQNPHPPVNSEF